MDYLLPFICMAIVVLNGKQFKQNPPFKIDDIKVNTKIETIDTSSGSHIKHKSFDFEYDDEILEYSTGWKINDKGLYERTETHYRLNNRVDINDVDKVLSMSKEEIENMLEITNIKTITKSSLSEEDSIYNKDAIIVINHTESDEETIVKRETTKDNIIWSILYILIVACFGNSLRTIGNFFIKTYARDTLRKYEPSFRPLNTEELVQLKKALELKKQNLNMITTSENNYELPYKLRKVQRGNLNE